MAHTHESRNSAAHWLHLLLLLALVSALQAGRLLSYDGIFTFPVFARSLYIWLPALAGIAISIAGPHAKITSNGIQVGGTVILLMICLDVSGSLVFAEGESAALFGDASVGPM